MLRVGNLQRSIDFYTQVLGMSLIRTSENPEYKYSLAFLGFEGGNPVQAEIELTYNWGTEQYDLGSNMSVSDACTNFHSYQLIWDGGKVAIGVDGVTYFTYSKPATFDYNTWPFDNPQYLILNLAIGGDLGGAVPIGFVSDQMVVDYVRVYQK